MQTSPVFLEYSDVEHRYFADGLEMPSVTQILDASGLISPFCRDEEARFRGTVIHELAAKDDVNPLDMRKVPKHLRGYLRAWRRFRQDTGFSPTHIEHRIDCKEFGYSGRFDRLGFIQGDPIATFIDIKTAKTGAVPDYARLQLVAYAFAFDPRRVFGRMAVSLKPDGFYNCKPYSLGTYYIDRAEWLGLVRKQENKNGRN